MGVVNDGQGDTSLLSGHQDPAPNSNAARLRLDRPRRNVVSVADGQTSGIAALHDNEARIVVLVQDGRTTHLFVRDDNLDLEAVGRVFHKTSHLRRIHRRHPGYTANSSRIIEV